VAAEKLFVQMMQTRKTVLGPDHPNTLTSMNNLASTYLSQGRWTEAEKLNIKWCRQGRQYRTEHPGTLASMGTWHFPMGIRDDGRRRKSCQLQVMETKKTVLGLASRHLISMANLAIYLSESGTMDGGGKLECR